jgi:hypothetical protein
MRVASVPAFATATVRNRHGLVTNSAYFNAAQFVNKSMARSKALTSFVTCHIWIPSGNLILISPFLPLEDAESHQIE